MTNLEILQRYIRWMTIADYLDLTARIGFTIGSVSFLILWFIRH